MSEFVYALYHFKNEKKIFFYVGHSRREPGVRFKEHQQCKNKTDVYRYIDEQVLCGIFEEEILHWVSEDENFEDCEDYWVVSLIRSGHILQNEKHGDARRMAATSLAHSSTLITSVRDIKEYKEKIAGERAAKLREKVLAEGVVAEESAFMKEYMRDSREKAAKKVINQSKRAESKARADREHQKWLAEQNHLFINGEIDALGNQIV